MSVFISSFDIAPGYWQVTHDDGPGGAHSGQIPSTDVVYATAMDGSHDHNFAIVVCPVCGSGSTHPVGGGAQAESVQEMFVRLAESEGCPCPENLSRGRSAAEASQHVRAHCEAMDGVGRWRL